MIEILAIVLAVVLLFASQLVRTLASVVLPKIAVRRLPERAAPAPWAELYQQAGAELAALGFDAGHWLLLDFDPPEAGAHRLVRRYVHAADGASAIVAPPTDLARPGRPTVSIATHLVDGRQLITSARQPLLELLASDTILRQDVPLDDIAAQYRAHQQWRAGHAVAADPDSLDPRWEASTGVARYHAHLEELVALGRMWRDGAGRARLTWRSLLAAIGVLLRAPRSAAVATALPAARVLALFRLHDLARLRTPAPGAQWLLFLASALLFAVLGAVLWDLAFALALLAVIAFHEAGHWLAMRLFGYRNLQVLMIPLLGGVAMGIERQPHATQRAVVSLMGPLPGIVLGWTLLLAAWQWPAAPAEGLLADVTGHLPLMLLVLNYLNLLPIPPLDGGHFVQALLPRQWARVELGFLLVAVVAGVALAWYLESIVIALLVLLQLFAVRTHLNEGRAARELAAAVPGYGALGVAEQRRLAFEHWAPRAAPNQGLARLLGQVDTVRQLAAIVPPRPAMRALLLAGYGLLFALPLLALLPWLGTGLAMFGNQREFAERLVEREQLVAEVAALPLTVLLGQWLALERGPVASAPFAAIDIAAAEQRLGIALDPAARELLSLPGAAALGLLPPARWRTVGEDDGLVLAAVRGAEVVAWPLAGDEPVVLPAGALDGWIVLAEPDEQSALLLNPAPRPGAPVVIDFFAESPTVFDSLRQWLEQRLVDARLVARARERGA